MTTRDLSRRLRAIEDQGGDGITVWRQVAADTAEGPDGQRVRLAPTPDDSGLDFLEEEAPAGPGLHVLVRRFSFEEADSW
jgi:hypothetical protein